MGKTFKKPIAMLNHQEHPNVTLHDWRLHAATSLSKPALLGGQILDIGTVVKAAKPMKMIKKGPKINLGAPNVTSMFLNMAATLDNTEKSLHAFAATLSPQE